MTIIGIDLGTSNSAAAVLRGGRPVLIPSAEGISLGGKAFPSYVALTADGQMLIGEPARRQASANPEGTATAFKRLMGTRRKVRLRDREFTPEQLAAFLLQKIKRDAEAFLGEAVKDAVVTVPAYFDDNQRSATKDAASIAGLNVLRLVNEPTAASLAYGLDRLQQELRIAVIDFGGGTLDVTLMESGKGVFEVKATSGDTQLGGTDMNNVLFDHLAGRFREQTGIDVKADPRAAARLLEAAEIAKIELSASTTAHITLPFIGMARGQPQHFDADVTCAELERVVRPVIERCRGPVTQALHDAGIEIDAVVPLETIAGGGEQRIRYERLDTCRDCGGSGAKAGTRPRTCPACKGTGQKVTDRREQGVLIRQSRPCPGRGGRGSIIDTPCSACGGRGTVPREESLAVTIPPGAEEGLVLRIAGKGYASEEPGGVPGDLHVVVRSAPDARFERDGADLWRTESLGVADAVLGTELRVPTLEGSVSVKVPPSTQPGAELRLRGKGLPRFRARGRGDLYVRLAIGVPERLTAEERRLWEKLRALRAARS
ncbi:MAG: Hsp70 family protein [Betaproteobacteria bacterium]|nr:Hsp70 family protein [Betaproteobacteria bacterium]